ncbi:MAG: hypothetical protein QM733_01155 [Ilumatobacteraceae bacterium]
MTDARNHRDQCAIVGIGATEYSNRSGRSELTLAVEACSRAVEDAGLKPRDIDGIIRSTDDVVLHNELAFALGTPNLTYWGHSGTGGSAPCAMVGQAVAAILAGEANNVLLYRSLNGRSGRRFGLSTAAADEVGGRQRQAYDEFFVPYGLSVPGQMFAIIARRHMIDFGTTRRQLGSIALACRAAANRNPNAVMQAKTLSMDDYLAARPIAEPLCLLDFCLETDGAAAVVVTRADRMQDGPSAGVLIRAVAQGTGQDVQLGRFLPSLMRPTITSFPSRDVARTLYARAGLGPADIDVAQIYDCFTISVLVQLEDYGFCTPGEGGPFVESGSIDLDGALPINTAGGHLSEAYLHGMNHILEGVRQMRGESTAQVAGAETCLVTGGVPTASAAIVLRRA